jgi:hypothetical protein
MHETKRQHENEKGITHQKRDTDNIIIKKE